MHETNWQRRPVEKRIMPLVQALNRPGTVWTLASCEGHPTRRIGPYVFFSCAVGVAAKIAKCLSHLYTDGRLFYYWEIVGRLHPTDGRLSYRLQAPALEAMGIVTELRLCVSRRKLDDDLALMGKEINDLVGSFVEGQSNSSSDQNDDSQYSAPPPLPCLVPVGIRTAATRAAGRIPGNRTPTNHATGQTTHNPLHQAKNSRLNLSQIVPLEEAP